MMEVRSKETVTQFLHRVSLARDRVLDHVHAPWEGVLAELKEEAAVAEEASFRQSFVWDVSMGMAASQGFLNSFEKLQPVSRYDWPDW
ncbi:hypothetical protein ESCO_005618 [Escovopsis weberi]|uniref:Uncharacterized protein n=1 Tax=Escovopsis weberi TaxID=150374 RepID=A0A0M8N3H8_ESCWE|nr:hypothetical protein ESCO_005618 [Escovopsis weberi]